MQYQPALGDILHPGADVGEKVAGPEETEVAMAQGAGEARNLNDGGRSRVSNCRVCNGPQGQAIDGVSAQERGFGGLVRWALNR